LRDKAELEKCANIVEKIGVTVTDTNKIWEIANVTMTLKELKIPTDAKIVGLGAYNEPSLWALHLLGWSDLYGVDRNEKIYDQPFYNKIRYSYADIENTHFPPRLFDAALCLRVLADDSNLGLVFQEASRILKPGGFLIATVDFYPKKLKGHRSRRKIFSSSELLELIDSARKNGFLPLFGEQDLTEGRMARYSEVLSQGLNYSLAFFCMVKNEDQSRRKMPNRLSILTYSEGTGGMSEYTRILSDRLRNEADVENEVIDNSANATSDVVLIEYGWGLRRADELVRDVSRLTQANKKVIVEIHDSLLRIPPSIRRDLEKKALLTYRANEIAQFDHVREYFLYPHISYANVAAKASPSKNEICLGSFGFGLTIKRIGELVSLCRRLKVRGKFLISMNEELGNRGKKQFAKTIGSITKVNGVVVTSQGLPSSPPQRNGIIVKTGFFTIQEISRELEECSHLVFAHRSFYCNSGTMTLAKRFCKPIVALDSFQAKQAQVIRCAVFSSKRASLKEEILVSGAVLLGKLGVMPNTVAGRLGDLVREAISLVNRKPPSLAFFEDCSHELSKDEDGIKYLYSILQEITQ
jgi:SAM-dependent methyltransferase